jgi:hypothetical protein
MAKVNLSGMSVEALMDLRKRVDQMLFDRRAEIQKQIERMDRAIAVVGGARVVGSRGSVLKGFSAARVTARMPIVIGFVTRVTPVTPNLRIRRARRGHARGGCVRADGHAAVTADTVFSDYLTAAVTAAANQAAAELAGARAMLSVRRRMAR